MPGNEAQELLDHAWYAALNRLGGIITSGEDAQSIAAAKSVLEFASTFTQLGPPYLPDTDRPVDLDWHPNE